MSTVRLTMAQALVQWMAAQRVERDGVERPFFAGVWGIFGHGNVAGIGQALHQLGVLPYVLSRNEQAMVHAAAGYARMTNRLQTWACTSSIGPGATNMVTAAAGATINRLPVLLLPGDTFASRRPDPVLQQLEIPGAPDVTVNDALRPVSRFWSRLSRPEQLLAAAPEAMRVLADQAETGVATLALPQDVQAEAFDYPDRFFEPRTWEGPARVAGVRRPRRGGRAHPERAASAPRGRRRGHLLGGHRCAAAAGRRHRDASGGDDGGQGGAPLRPSVGRRRPGRDRHKRGEPPGP